MVRTEKDVDVYMQKIVQYLKHGTYSTDTARGERSGIRKCKSKFALIDDKLYYHAIDNPDAKRLVLMSDNERQRALREAHDFSGAHQGQTRTLARLTQDYYWHNMTECVKKWISTCDKCQMMDTMKTVTPMLHPIKVSDRWQILGIDLMGPFPVTSQGNNYVCTVTDLFTKWVFARPIASKSAASVAEVLLQLVYSYGPPTKMITDQGREFVNQKLLANLFRPQEVQPQPQLNEFIFKSFGVKQLITSAYHPQTNGQDERTNQTLKRALAKYTNADQTDWDRYVLSTSYAINTSVQTTTKCQPFLLMFYRHPLGATALNSQHDGEDDMTYDSVVSGVTDEDAHNNLEANISKVQASDEVIRQRIKEAKTKQKEAYDAKRRKGVKKFSFVEGDRVLLRKSQKEGRKGDRLTANWTGPYTIKTILPKGLCILAGSDGKELKAKQNMARIKPYMERPAHDVTQSRTAAANSLNEDAAHVGNAALNEVVTAADSIATTNEDYAFLSHVAVVDDHEYALPTVHGSSGSDVHQQRSTATASSGNNAPEGSPTPSTISTLTAVGDDFYTEELNTADGSRSQTYPDVSRALHVADMSILCDASECINDNIINAAQQLLRHQYTTVGGLYDTVAVAACDVQHTPDNNGDTVQIVFDSVKSHWYTVTNKHCASGHLSIYCSLQLTPSMQSLATVAKLFRLQSTSLTVDIMNVAKQRGSVDCGLFAIANAELLAHDRDPCNVTFDQPQMRHHLKRCLEMQCMRPFPVALSRSTRRRVVRAITVPLYCICRSPHVTGNNMVRCDQCREWYHQLCVGIGNETFERIGQPTVPYTCPACRDTEIMDCDEQPHTGSFQADVHMTRPMHSECIHQQQSDWDVFMTFVDNARKASLWLQKNTVQLRASVVEPWVVTATNEDIAQFLTAKSCNNNLIYEHVRDHLLFNFHDADDVRLFSQQMTANGLLVNVCLHGDEYISNNVQLP